MDLRAAMLSGRIEPGRQDDRAETNGQASRADKGGQSKAAIQKAAKDMEALFAYELIKAMRRTVGSISKESGGLGGDDSYTTLFDMELSRVMAERGIGLQDAIIRWMDRNQVDRGDGLDRE